MTTRHELLECVHQTPHGSVWCARHAETGALLALKTQRKAPPPALLKLRHENVVPVLEIHPPDEDGFWLCVMPWVEGTTLEEKGGDNSFDELVRQTLAGLAAVHDAGLLHLDLKPENILVSADSYQISDFGNAREAGAARADLHGSVHWMAPECFEGAELDARTDLYALGCVIYFAWSGMRPFEGELAPQVITAHLQHRVEPLPGAVGAWIGRLMSRRPADRPGSAAAALEAYAEIAQDGAAG
jgi:serine/threonine protein kinase